MVKKVNFNAWSSVCFSIMSNVCDTLTLTSIVVSLWIRENTKMITKKRGSESQNESEKEKAWCRRLLHWAYGQRDDIMAKFSMGNDPPKNEFLTECHIIIPKFTTNEIYWMVSISCKILDNKVGKIAFIQFLKRAARTVGELQLL